MELVSKLNKTSSSGIMAIGILMVIGVGVLDSFTGKEIAFSAFYLVPVLFVTWFAGKKPGYIIAVLCTGAWVIADGVTGQVFSSFWIHVWNAVSRFLVYGVVVHFEVLFRHQKENLELDVERTSIDLSIEKVEHKRTFESVKRLSLFPELNPNPILEIDAAGKLTYFNKAAGDFLDSLGIADYDAFFPEDIEEILKGITKDTATAIVREKKIGNVVLEEYIYFIRSFKVVQIYALDITVRKKAEEDIRKSLKEKEVLIREIHHRVKNNLQIISSLLKLQTAFIKDKGDLAVFVESQRRINSIASIHQMLYKEGNVANIEANRFLNDLASKLSGIYEDTRIKVRFDIQADGIVIDADIANPLGLLATEIISNSFKYAFTPGNDALVFIKMFNDDNGKLVMEIGDNGKGFVINERNEKSPTLGLQLIRLLSQQLDATLDLDSSAGTKYRVVINLAQPAPVKQSA